jgi:predicted nucleic acid-binding protein
LQLVLDANVYIFGFGFLKVLACEKLLSEIAEKTTSYNIFISRSIVNEVGRNLSMEDFRKFILFINTLTKIDEDFLVPFELGAKYETKGLKPADALIAAYTEWVGADALVTENRHFLFRHKDLPFKVVTAQACLKMLSK